MARKKANNLSTKKGDYKFQVGCVSYLNLKQKKAQKEKFDIFCLLDLILNHHNEWGKH